jgi:hypothetical protein
LAKYLKNILITVKDSQGTPLENVTVVITNGDGQNRFIGVTDEKGEVLFESAMPGEYFFEYQGSGIRNKNVSMSIPLDGDTSLNLMETVQLVTSLTLSFVDETGNPVNDVFLVMAKCPEEQENFNVTCNKTVLLENLIPGSYFFRVFVEGYEPEFETFYLDSSPTHTELISLKPVASTAKNTTIYTIDLIFFIATVSTVAIVFLLRTSSVLPKSDKIEPSESIKPASPKTEEDIPKKVRQVYPKPKHWGTTKGEIIKAVAIDGKDELIELKNHLNLPEKEFYDNFYELLILRLLEGTTEGTFIVEKQLRIEWRNYFSQNVAE